MSLFLGEPKQYRIYITSVCRLNVPNSEHVVSFY